MMINFFIAMTELICPNCEEPLEYVNIELDGFTEKYPLMWFVNFKCVDCAKRFLITVYNKKMRTFLSGCKLSQY